MPSTVDLTSTARGKFTIELLGTVYDGRPMISAVALSHFHMGAIFSTKQAREFAAALLHECDAAEIAAQRARQVPR